MQQIDSLVAADPITFVTDSVTLTREGTATVDHVAACLVANPPARVQIDGYANGTGASDASQRAVSEQRAMTVRDRMVQQDVTTDRITTVGMGAADSNGADSRPVEKVVL
ncbi:MAG TPA: OmpA family protein [Aldersonia sp.]